MAANIARTQAYMDAHGIDFARTSRHTDPALAAQRGRHRAPGHQLPEGHQAEVFAEAGFETSSSPSTSSAPKLERLAAALNRRIFRPEGGRG